MRFFKTLGLGPIFIGGLKSTWLSVMAFILIMRLPAAISSEGCSYIIHLLSKENRLADD
jgi:hypothetical protein